MVILYPVVPAQITTIPPVSHINPDVGNVASPGCSNTILGFFLSPSISQIALPNARAPLIKAPYSGDAVSGIAPQ